MSLKFNREVAQIARTEEWDAQLSRLVLVGEQPSRCLEFYVRPACSYLANCSRLWYARTSRWKASVACGALHTQKQ